MATMTLTMKTSEYKMIVAMVKENGIDEFETVRVIDSFEVDGTSETITLERAVAFGIEFFQWAADASGDRGDLFTTEAQAVKQAEKAAKMMRRGEVWC